MKSEPGKSMMKDVLRALLKNSWKLLVLAGIVVLFFGIAFLIMDYYHSRDPWNQLLPQVALFLIALLMVLAWGGWMLLSTFKSFHHGEMARGMAHCLMLLSVVAGSVLFYVTVTGHDEDEVIQTIDLEVHGPPDSGSRSDTLLQTERP